MMAMVPIEFARLAALGMTHFGPDIAAQYPTTPIRLLAPIALDGGQYIVARLIAPKLADVLGLAVVFENRVTGISTRSDAAA